MVPMISTNVQAEVVKELKTGFPNQEVFTPGDWFLGQKPGIMMRINLQFFLYKEGMGMLIVGMERQCITI